MKLNILILFLCLSSLICAKTVQETVQKIDNLRTKGRYKEAATEVANYMQENGENKTQPGKGKHLF